MTRPLHLLLLRHGQTDSNAGGIIQGHLPVPLNDLGHRQARALAGRLREHRPRIGRLVSSDLPRAAQTAQPLARALGLEIAFDAGWRERFLGAFQGKTVGERRTWSAASGQETPPGAESLAEFESRIAAALHRLDAPADGSPLAVVTHGGPIRVILRLLLDGRLPLDGDHALDEVPTIHNCSILRLHRTAAATWQIACINDVAHLEALNATAPDAG
jgi:probable phosphoglycerate mutase